VKVSIFSSLLRVGTLIFGLIAACFLITSCSADVQIDPVDPPPVIREPATTKPDPTEFGMWKGKTGPAPTFPLSSHLKECKSPDDCGSNMTCLNLGTAVCLFKCDPKKGTGSEQNPSCIAPENCISLSGGETGACISFPGQLYGSGSYTALIRHKQGEKCLLHYGGCVERHICVDTSNNGAVGTCIEECFPAVNPKSKVEPNCLTPKTTCKKLVSGLGACLP